MSTAYKYFRNVAFTLLICFVLATPAFSDETHFSFTNSKGAKYYLYGKSIALKNSEKTRTIYFFSKSPDNSKGTPLTEVPEGKRVSETKKGLPVLKNISSPDK